MAAPVDPVETTEAPPPATAAESVADADAAVWVAAVASTEPVERILAPALPPLFEIPLVPVIVDVSEPLVLVSELDVLVSEEDVDVFESVEVSLFPPLLPTEIVDLNVITQTRSSRTRSHPSGALNGVRVMSHISVTGPCALQHKISNRIQYHKHGYARNSCMLCMNLLH